MATTISIVGLKGGIGKTTTMWNICSFFQKKYRDLGYGRMKIIDLDYSQSNFKHWNGQKDDDAKFDITTIKNGQEFIDYTNSENSYFDDEETINFIDTGRFDNKANVFTYIVSDLIIGTLNPSEEIEVRNSINTLTRIDKILEEQKIDAVTIHILYTRVHTSCKEDTFEQITDFLEDLPFKKIAVKVIPAFVYNNKRHTSNLQYGLSFWEEPKKVGKDGKDKIYENMERVMKYIVKNIEEDE